MRNDCDTVIAIGSNAPDAERHVTKAAKFLKALLGDCKVSSSYSTPALGKISAPRYTNAVANGTAFFPIPVVISILKAYERMEGRKPDAETVKIDLDLVMANREVLRERDFGASYFQIGFQELLST